MRECRRAGRQERTMHVEDGTCTSRLRQLGRASPGPATIGRNSDVVQDIRQSSAASRRSQDIDRRAAEIARLVRLAEQIAADAERRQQPPAKSSSAVAAVPMPGRTDNDDSAKRRLPVIKNVRNDVILMPVARTTPAVSASASDGRRRCRVVPSPLTLSQLLDVKSPERCPKCHKVRLDVGSTNRDVGAAHSHKEGSGRNGHRVVTFKALVRDSPTTVAGHSRSRKTTTEANEPGGVRTSSTTTRTLNTSRCSTPVNRNVSRGQSRGGHIPECNGTVVVLSVGADRQDINNNNDHCESGGTNARSTWPRNLAHSKVSNNASTTLIGDNGRSSARPVGRKRPSLSAVQQMWAEQSERRTATADDEVDRNVDNNNPPSAASSYDPLDTVDDTADRGYTSCLLRAAAVYASACYYTAR